MNANAMLDVTIRCDSVLHLRMCLEISANYNRLLRNWDFSLQEKFVPRTQQYIRVFPTLSPLTCGSGNATQTRRANKCWIQLKVWRRHNTAATLQFNLSEHAGDASRRRNQHVSTTHGSETVREIELYRSITVICYDWSERRALQIVPWKCTSAGRIHRLP